MDAKVTGPALHAGRWRNYLADCGTLLDFIEPMQVSGRVTRVAGLVMEAVGLRLAVGAACTVPLPAGGKVEAEVVGFEGERLFLMPQSDVEGIVPGTRVFPIEPSIPKPGSVTHQRRRTSDRARQLPVGRELLGRVVDAAGRPLDGLGPINTTDSAPINVRPANPLGRAPIVEMSARASEMMREDLESKGPVRLSEVETQQKQILQIVRRLSDEGQIVLGGKGEDSFV